MCYARVRGAAIMTTTYGVGELCTLGALMGARAHRLPVFHLVGMPSLRIQRQHRVTHHSLGDGVYGNFIPIAASVACVHTQLTADNAVDEIERVIREALRQSAPAYILLPEDQAHLPLLGTPIDGKPLCQIKRQLSAPAELEAAVAALADAVNQSRRPVVMPTALLQRYGVAKEAEELLRKTGLPFATTPMDKAVVSEALQGFLGVYLGMASAASAKDGVEKADLMLDLGGTVATDENTGCWTHKFPAHCLIVGDNYVRIGSALYTNVAIDDVVRELSDRLRPRDDLPSRGEAPQQAVVGKPEERITSAAFFSRLEKMLRPTDVLIAGTGTSILPLAKVALPDGAGYESQMLWGAIGWATPAALGVALADTSKRAILVTGDGAHQISANEIGVMGRAGIKPVIFVLHNDLYGIEVVLSETGHTYDDLARWDYHKLPAVMGCTKWYSAKLEDKALAHLDSHDGAALSRS